MVDLPIDVANPLLAQEQVLVQRLRLVMQHLYELSIRLPEGKNPVVVRQFLASHHSVLFSLGDGQNDEVLMDATLWRQQLEHDYERSKKRPFSMPWSALNVYYDVAKESLFRTLEAAQAYRVDCLGRCRAAAAPAWEVAQLQATTEPLGGFGFGAVIGQMGELREERRAKASRPHGQ